MICFIKNGLECNNGEECSMASEQHQNDDSLLVFVTESQVHSPGSWQHERQLRQ